MKSITLYREADSLSEAEITSLAKFGIVIKGLTLTYPDDLYIYCRPEHVDDEDEDPTVRYCFYCHDDNEAFFTIDIGPDTQCIFWNSEEIKAASKRLSEAQMSPLTSQYNNAFTLRKKLIQKGDYSSLFAVPFDQLRYDEKALVKQHGYCFETKAKELKKYFPLSNNGIAVVALIKDTLLTSQTQSTKGQNDSVRQANSVLDDIRSGNHQLTQGMTRNQIEGYVSIAQKGFAPIGFEEENPKRIQLRLLCKNFKKGINSENGHTNLDANEAGFALVTELEKKAAAFILGHEKSKPNKQEVDAFKEECQTLLREAKGTLQKDSHLLKSVTDFFAGIINYVVSSLTHPFTNRFEHGLFKSDLHQKAEALKQNVEDLLENSNIEKTKPTQ